MKYLSDWVGYSQETWLDVNCLSVNENTLITTGKDLENIKKLESFGFDVIIWNYRHSIFGMVELIVALKTLFVKEKRVLC